MVYDSKIAYVQILTENIERSLSEKDVNFTCFVKKKKCLFSSRALLEESPPGPCLCPRIAIKIWLNFVSKGSINNDPSLIQIMAWCRSATSPHLIEWWPSSLMHISVAGNTRIVIYGECCYAMQRHRFTMNYQKARCNTQHQPPSYASTSTQRGYADLRRHLLSSLVIRQATGLDA